MMLFPGYSLSLILPFVLKVLATISSIMQRKECLIHSDTPYLLTGHHPRNPRTPLLTCIWLRNVVLHSEKVVLLKQHSWE